MAKNQDPKNSKKRNKPIIARPLWYLFLVLGIVSLACAFFLIIRWCMNAYYVAEAKKGVYHHELEESLTKFNFPDGYVVWYNIANYHYTEGDFKDAEDDYYRALDLNVPYMKECPVKVNLALAMIEQISDDEWDAFFESDGSDAMSADARKVEKTLITARTLLIEDGCAHEDDEDGHNEQAQILKDEIDELLQNNDNDNDEDDDENDDNNDSDGDNSDSGDDNSDGDGGGSSSREDQIMDHIQDQKEEAQAERAEDQQFYENYYGFGDEDQQGGNGGQDQGDGNGGGGSPEETGEVW